LSGAVPPPTGRPERGRVLVVGLGPGSVDDVTAGTLAAVAASGHRFLRTARHPSASVVPDARSFDHVYDEAGSFEEVYAAIVEALVAAAGTHGEVLYAVPGSPLVGERTVELLLADARVDVRVLPALSFLDLAWVRLGVDPMASRVRVIDGMRFAAHAAGDTGPLLVAQCHSLAVLSEIKLALDTDLTGPGPEVTVLQRLGLPDEQMFRVPWADLDRVVQPDHLTSVYIAELAAPVASELVALVELMQVLREQCPWDAEQTHASLARYAVEEAYELVEAIDALSGALEDPPAATDPVDHLQDELGDVLLQVVFHACLAAEEGWFTLADVARAQREKLVYRHPHVFPRP
jgi:tetrapyrrole methylase family protein/MazG family protein